MGGNIENEKTIHERNEGNTKTTTHSQRLKRPITSIPPRTHQRLPTTIPPRQPQSLQRPRNL